MEATYCLICRDEIPEARAIRKSNTCKDECNRVLKARRRKAADEKKCRHCGRPSSVEERKQFQEWRKTQPNYLRKRGRKKIEKPEEAQA